MRLTGTPSVDPPEFWNQYPISHPFAKGKTHNAVAIGGAGVSNVDLDVSSFDLLTLLGRMGAGLAQDFGIEVRPYEDDGTTLLDYVLPSEILERAVERITADPAAGSEISFTADEDMTIVSARATLVTSGVAANRGVRLRATDSAGNVLWETVANFAQIAATTMIYDFFSGAESVPNVNGVTVVTFPAGGLKLRKGDILSTSTLNFDVGDNWSSMVLQVESPSLASYLTGGIARLAKRIRLGGIDKVQVRAKNNNVGAQTATVAYSLQK